MSESMDETPARLYGLPLVVQVDPDGVRRPTPFLMSRDDLAALFRLHDSGTRFPRATINRYRRMGLKSVRIGRRVWFRLDDVLRFLDEQQMRFEASKY